MEFKQIEAFVNVVRYKSFSKAADASFLTQPTISAHVSTLENELGVQLIERMGKESRPTKEGRAFYKFAQDMINTRERAIITVKQDNKEIGGVLELQASSAPGQYMIPKLISEFNRRYPHVKFYIEQSDSSEVIRNIGEQKGEIGFAGYHKHNGLMYEKLCESSCVIITPKNEFFENLHKNGKSISLKELKAQSFIWREEGSATRKEFEEEYIHQTGSKPNVIATINSIAAIKESVRVGLGISILPKMAIENHSNDDILCFDLKEKEFNREFYMVYGKDAVLSPTAMEFKKFVIEYYKNKQRG